MSNETMNGRAIEIKVPLEKWVVDLATHAGKEGAKCVLVEHKTNCEALKALPKLLKDTETMRLGWAKLTGLMIGTAIGGGGLAAAIVKLFGV